MRFTYKTKDVCAAQIDFDITDGVVSDIHFHGGCNGNLKMIAKLLENKRAEEIVDSCEGNTCGWKRTSCADQLAQAVKAAMKSAK